MQGKADHFKEVLNVDRPVNAEIWDELPDMAHLAAEVPWDPPDLAELRRTILALSNGKAPDFTGVHAELLSSQRVSGRRLFDVRSSRPDVPPLERRTTGH